MWWGVLTSPSGDLELYITATISIFNIYMDLYINIQQREIFMENYIVVKCFAMLVCRQHTYSFCIHVVTTNVFIFSRVFILCLLLNPFLCIYVLDLLASCVLCCSFNPCICALCCVVLCCVVLYLCIVCCVVLYFVSCHLLLGELVTSGHGH